ncbi:MAG: class I SAM-dependent methyltransferase [Nitrospiraceae bacterium]
MTWPNKASLFRRATVLLKTNEKVPIRIETFSLVRQHRRMLANMNVYLTHESRILDFGCGNGVAVYVYRDAGLDAYGFDIYQAPVYRRPEDQRYFRFFLTGKPASVPNYCVDASSYKIAFEDEWFNFVFSESTLEHVLDHDLAFAETARVLKKGGVALHTFPARCALIEPHMFIPFGGVIQNYPWFLLWAILGVRNQFQRQMGPVECAKSNLHYARTGLNYARLNNILTTAGKYFSHVELVPRLWELYDKGFGSFKGALLITPHVHRYVRWVYSRFLTVVLFLRK